MLDQVTYNIAHEKHQGKMSDIILVAAKKLILYTTTLKTTAFDA